VAEQLLRAAGVDEIARCDDAVGFLAALGEDKSFAVATEESLGMADLRGIGDWVASQPSWSDLPFVILTRHGGGVERNPAAARLAEILGNVTLLERPFHPTTFVSVARTALKGRQRQYEARARLRELRALNETLEERVAERTKELSEAHQEVLAEIEQRERAEDQLRHAQKMEMIGQLTGGVAHDFNNLLMAVIGNLDLLRKQVADDSRAMRYIDSAMQGAQRGAALTQRLLAFARRQDLRVEPKNLIDLVRGMTGLLERSLGTKVELRLDLPTRLPSALVDANQIELALLNLAVNARDAMPEGGVLTVKLDLREGNSSSDLPPGRYVCLSVRDTGTGMDAETLRRAAEPFFSTKELGKGTGLGLSMIQGLAVQLKGALRMASEPGRGTVAELWLPVTSRAETPAEPEAAPAADDEARNLTILVVDDDFLISMSTVDMLEDLGHRVLEANSGERALEILDKDQVDLLITDYAMPKMTGAELASRARDLRPDLPILLATGYAELPQGSDLNLPRLAKPYQQRDLEAEIAKVLKQAAA